MFDKLKNKLTEVRKIAEEKAVENLIIDKVSPEIQKERISICRNCDKLYKPTEQCKLCGCFMNVKTWMPHIRCPAHKWLDAPIHSVGKIEN
jgi:hypothetical protein